MFKTNKQTNQCNGVPDFLFILRLVSILSQILLSKKKKKKKIDLDWVFSEATTDILGGLTGFKEAATSDVLFSR